MLKRGRRVEVELPTVILRTAAMGAISGVRTMTAPAVLARAIQRGDVGNLSATPFAVLGSKRAATLLQALMIGEMVGDKTPFIPARTSAPALFGRALSGALVGSALFLSGGRGGAPGALVGVFSALAGVYAADLLRSGATQGLGVPDRVFGLIEDALVLCVGTQMLKRGR